MSVVVISVMLLFAPATIADERRLSPTEVERILEEAAARRVAAAEPPAPVIEGEVGVTIGTSGIREVFGTAVVPVGNATAIISISGEESDRPKRRR